MIVTTMIDCATKSDGILRRLAVLLASRVLPTQQVIAAEIGCDQPFISRAANGQLIRITGRVTDLRRYVIMRVRTERLMKGAGLEAELAPLIQAGSKSRQLKSSRHSAPSVADRYVSEALAGTRMYLADGYDARLLIEQIAMLRRAQRIRWFDKPRSLRGSAAEELSQ